jgi:hypothetical protein
MTLRHTLPFASRTLRLTLILTLSVLSLVALHALQPSTSQAAEGRLFAHTPGLWDGRIHAGASHNFSGRLNLMVAVRNISTGFTSFPKVCPARLAWSDCGISMPATRGHKYVSLAAVEVSPGRYSFPKQSPVLTMYR